MKPKELRKGFVKKRRDSEVSLHCLTRLPRFVGERVSNWGLIRGPPRGVETPNRNR